MTRDSPEDLVQKIVAACGACEDCRSFMEETCLFLAELFRLHDRQRETGRQHGTAELRHLIDLCNLCGLCPCANIRGEILAAKTACAERDGLPFGVRVLQDVGRVGKMCGAFPRMSGMMIGNPLTSPLLKRSLGIHPDRALPAAPSENLDDWLRQRPAASVSINNDNQRKAVYFPGCTARYFFPEVARAAVEVLEACGVDVVVPMNTPDGVCCGMPPLLEGDRAMALGLASRNLRWMAEHVAAGYDVVCSCPTCAYFFRRLLPEGAYYSEAYQRQAGADANWLRIPAGMGINGPREGDMVVLQRSIYGSVLRDKGMFSGLAPLQRIAVGEHTRDLGEYLAVLAKEDRLPEMAHPVSSRALYYPPCHLREQKIGFPFLELLARVPRLSVSRLAGTLHCCGMAGIMGYKKQFHLASLQLGAPLMDKIRAHQPETIITECLSCRLQFQHMDTIPVQHPVEVLRSAM